MLKASDLRIGNIVYDTSAGLPNTSAGLPNTSAGLPKGYMVIVDRKHIQDPANLEPVPLTEEMLTKLGFTKDPISSYVWWNGKFRVQFGMAHSELKYGITIMVGGDEIYAVMYAHALQNLYHSLTGEELTFKD